MKGSLRWFLFGMLVYGFSIYGFWHFGYGLLMDGRWREFAAENNCTEHGKRWADVTPDRPIGVEAFDGVIYLCDDGWSRDRLVVR